MLGCCPGSIGPAEVVERTRYRHALRSEAVRWCFGIHETLQGVLMNIMMQYQFPPSSVCLCGTLDEEGNAKPPLRAELLLYILQWQVRLHVKAPQFTLLN